MASDKHDIYRTVAVRVTLIIPEGSPSVPELDPFRSLETICTLALGGMQMRMHLGVSMALVASRDARERYIVFFTFVWAAAGRHVRQDRKHRPTAGLGAERGWILRLDARWESRRRYRSTVRLRGYRRTIGMYKTAHMKSTAPALPIVSS